ncbi:hypothetical protein D3C86_2233270 [compost metagenome]
MGRCTFTAAGVPSFSTAWYTWPMEAAAMGVSGKEMNRSPRLAPSSSSTIFTASA